MGTIGIVCECRIYGYEYIWIYGYMNIYIYIYVDTSSDHLINWIKKLGSLDVIFVTCKLHHVKEEIKTRNFQYVG